MTGRELKQHVESAPEWEPSIDRVDIGACPPMATVVLPHQPDDQVMSSPIHAGLLTDKATPWLPGTLHPNVLVVGTDITVDDVLRTLQCVCRQPVVTCWATDPLVLPSPPASGTLILRGVDTLSLDGQRPLLAWLDNVHGCTQIISTSAQALWPRLDAGTFLHALYYRLNLVYFDLAQHQDADTDTRQAYRL